MSKYFACKINKCNLKHGFTTKFIINHVFLITKKRKDAKSCILPFIISLCNWIKLQQQE